MNIQRTMFWFRDMDESIIEFNDLFFSLGLLLNRLINRNYERKDIKLINIDFNTPKTYVYFLNINKDTYLFSNNVLKYYGEIDLDYFINLSFDRQKKYLWHSACKYLIKSSMSLNNKELLNSIEIAYKDGLELNLSLDLKLLTHEFVFNKIKYESSLSIIFKEKFMYSVFMIEKNGEVLFEKEIERVKNGVSFFITMYKKIDFKNNNFVIKGHKDVEYLPLKILFEDFKGIFEN